MRKITKRDVQFFILGILTCFIVDLVTDWQGTKESFNKGYNEGLKTTGN